MEDEFTPLWANVERMGCQLKLNGTNRSNSVQYVALTVRLWSQHPHN